jgi:hypothetical protein
VKNQRSEIEYVCIREGFVEGFMNAYNLASLELGKLNNPEMNRFGTDFWQSSA